MSNKSNAVSQKSFWSNSNSNYQLKMTVNFNSVTQHNDSGIHKLVNSTLQLRSTTNLAMQSPFLTEQSEGLVNVCGTKREILPYCIYHEAFKYEVTISSHYKLKLEKNSITSHYITLQYVK